MRLLVTLVFVPLSAAGPAAAQDFSMPGTSPMDLAGVQSATLSAQIGNLSLGQVARDGSGRGAPIAPRAGGPTGAMTYRVTPAISQAAVRGYIARASKKNPQAAKHMGDQFAKHDYRAAYRGLIAGTGLRENDALDALTAYTALGWMITHNAFSDPDPAALKGLRAQLAPRFDRTSAFSDPGTRAALGEELKLLFVTLHSGWQSAKREGALSQYSGGVAQLFRRQGGADLTQVKLGPAGFSR